MLSGTPRHDAQRNIDTARSVFAALGDLRSLVSCDAIVGALSLREGELLSAMSACKSCLRSSWGKDTEIQVHCLEMLGNGSCWSPMDWTSTWTITFLACGLNLKQNLLIHKALQFLANVFWVMEDTNTAISLLTVALEGFTQMDVHCSRAECMLHLGDISNLQGNSIKAVEFWETARPLFERSSQAKQLAHIDERLTSAKAEKYTSTLTQVRGVGTTDEDLVEIPGTENLVLDDQIDLVPIAL